ncbi:hypothetical protein [Geodermatophilus sp. CPCC 206100]|uniref:hypothetical protein n=1 Tax=Geodermatophilus sp. CPCC 206100 TaxID=3020054 RepID=UPI003AFFFDF7
MTPATRTTSGRGSALEAARRVLPAPGDRRTESPADRGGATIGSAALRRVVIPDAVRAVTPTRRPIPEEVVDLVRG